MVRRGRRLGGRTAGIGRIVEVRRVVERGRTVGREREMWTGWVERSTRMPMV